MLYFVELPYLTQGMLSHGAVLIECLKEMPSDMNHAIDKGHGGAGLEGCLIARKTVTLEISPEVMPVCQVLDYRPGPRPLVVVEDDQPLHHRPHHPEVFLRRLLPCVVYNGGGRLVGLVVVRPHHLGHQHVVEGPEQSGRLLEPAVDGALR